MLSKNLLFNRFKMGFCGKLVTVALVALIANRASADQFLGHQNGRQVVVHTNPFPVLMHRLVPPNYGRHVTIREYQATRRSTQPAASTVSNRNSPRELRNRQ